MASFNAKHLEFEDKEDRNLTDIVAAVITTNWLHLSTIQHRSLWARPRSHRFTVIMSTWDDAEWKRNFCVSKPTCK